MKHGRRVIGSLIAIASLPFLASCESYDVDDDWEDREEERRERIEDREEERRERIEEEWEHRREIDEIRREMDHDHFHRGDPGPPPY